MNRSITRYLPLAPVLVGALALSPAAAAVSPAGTCHIKIDCRAEAAIDALAAHVERHWAVNLRAVSCHYPRDGGDDFRVFHCHARAVNSARVSETCTVSATVDEVKPAIYKEVERGTYKEVAPGTYSIERVQAAAGCPKKQPHP